MKKFVKLVLPIVLILAVVLSFGACSSGKEDTAETPENSMAEEIKNDGADEVEEQSGEQLSASCDYILAQATDSKGNYIELVANDSETYDGSQTIGLIKNNKWVIEMTDDSPIIEDGVVAFFNLYKYCHNAGETNIILITDNCFVFFGDEDTDLLWNYSTGKTYYMTAEEFSNISYVGHYLGHQGKVLNEDLITIVVMETSTLLNTEIFDTKTMQFVKSFGPKYFNYVKQYSEGLFYAERSIPDENGNIEELGFYDINGNLVLDFTEFYNKYFDIYEPPERFIDGKTSFRVENESGKKFEITIDKQGNVLSETAV